MMPTLKNTTVSDVVEIKNTQEQTVELFYCRLYSGGHRKHVYWNINSSGEETFWENEDGDLRYYPFQPSAETKSAIRRFFNNPLNHGKREAYIDLDVDPQSILLAQHITLEEFRAFVHSTYEETYAVEIERRIVEFIRQYQIEPKMRSTSNEK